MVTEDSDKFTINPSALPHSRGQVCKQYLKRYAREIGEYVILENQLWKSIKKELNASKIRGENKAQALAKENLRLISVGQQTWKYVWSLLNKIIENEDMEKMNLDNCLKVCFYNGEQKSENKVLVWILGTVSQCVVSKEKKDAYYLYLQKLTNFGKW